MRFSYLQQSAIAISYAWRPNTERPITIHQGTNRICGLENLENHVETILSGRFSHGSVPELWDGKTASRVVKSIKSLLLE